MFGYIRPLREELKLREDAYYKSIYCGLCRTMRKTICRKASYTLSYDMVFLAILRYRLEEKEPDISFIKCPIPPFRKKAAASPDDVLKYCAAAGSLLSWHKFDDDAKDSKGVKKTFSKIIRALSGNIRKKAGLPELDETISKKMEVFRSAEKEACSTADSLADLFGSILSDVFSYGLEGNKKRIASETGLRVGRWIYLADAADDIEKDRKKKEFNPFLTGFDPEKCRNALILELEAASCAVDLIENRDDSLCSLTNNILHLGMPHRSEKVLKKYTDNTIDAKENK